jgi:HEAT repeat protein
MRKKGFIVLLVVVMLALVCMLATSDGRWILYGLSRGEGFHDFKPTSYWVEALNDKDPKVQKQALDALFYIHPKSPEVIPPLIAMIRMQSNEDTLQTETPKDEATPMRAYLTLQRILRGMGPNSRHATHDLIELLQSPGSWKRLWAADLLKEIGPDAKEAVPALRQALKTEKYGGAHKAAAEALEAIDPETAVPALIEALQSDMWDIKTVSARDLGSLGPKAKAAIPELRKALGHNKDLVREAAADALKKIDPESRHALEDP